MNIALEFSFLKSISTQASKSVIDLHVLIMRCDNRVSMSEQLHTQEVIDILPWSDAGSKDMYYQQSVAKVRAAIADKSTVVLLQEISNILNNQITTEQLELLTTMIVAADHVQTEAEIEIVEMLLNMQ